LEHARALRYRSPFWSPQNNTLAVKAENAPARRVYAWLRIIGADRRETIVASDGTWKISLDAKGDWDAIIFNDEKWPAAAVAGNSALLHGRWRLQAHHAAAAQAAALKLVHFCPRC